MKLGFTQCHGDPVSTGTVNRLPGPLRAAPLSRALGLRGKRASLEAGPRRAGLPCCGLPACYPFLKQTSGRGRGRGPEPGGPAAIGLMLGLAPAPAGTRDLSPLRALQVTLSKLPDSPRCPERCSHSENSYSDVSTWLLRGPWWGIGHPKTSVCHGPPLASTAGAPAAAPTPASAVLSGSQQLSPPPPSS